MNHPSRFDYKKALASAALLAGFGAATALPAATPPGRIVYSANAEGDDHQTHSQIFLVSPTGDGVTQVTRAPATCLLPDLSPDGSTIVFDSDLDNGGIHVVNANGSGLMPIPSLNNFFRATYSPDGTKFGLVGGTNGSDVWISNVDGSEKTQLTSGFNPVATSNVTWSPDGAKVAVSGYTFVNGHATTYGVFVIPVAGGAPVRLSTDLASDYRDPAWSPDGARISCTKYNSQTLGQLITLDASTGAETVVESSGGEFNEQEPCWSPDGAHLCAEAGDKDGLALVIINADGSGRHLITAGRAITPRWSNAGGVSGDSITISGYANVYNADVDTLSASSGLDIGTQPVSIAVSAKAGTGSITFPSVTGGVYIDDSSFNGGQGANPPDGGAYFAPEYVAALNGISGYALPKTGALIGVFLSAENAQTGQTAPASLDFTANGMSTDFKVLSPALGQVFFIGDGLASDGTVQKFNVPANAGILLLGIADGGNASTNPQPAHGYTDNGGAFNATYAFDAAGVSGPGLADLSVGLTASASTVQVGDEVTYGVTITNNGPDTATGIEGAIAGPASFAFISAVNAGTFSASGNTVVFHPPNLASGASEQVRLTFRADAGGVFTVVAGVHSAQTDPTPSTPAADSTTTTVQGGGATGSADLTLTVTDSPDPVAVGGQVTYTFTLTNKGPSAATNIQGGFVKDSKMSLVTSAGVAQMNVFGNTLSYKVPDLASGHTTTYSLTFSADAAGVYTVGAGVQAAEDDPHTADNGLLETTLATATPGGGGGAGAPVVTGAPGGLILVGEKFAYQIVTDGSVSVDTYGATGLPAGLSVNTATGLISGTIVAGTVPTGPFDVTLQANNGAGVGSSTVTFTVVAPPAGSKVADVTGKLKLAGVKLAGGGTQYKLTGSFAIKNKGTKTAKNLSAGIYLSKSPTFSFPVTSDPLSAGLAPLGVKLTPALDNKGQIVIDENGLPVFNVKISLPTNSNPVPPVPLPTIPAKAKYTVNFTLKASAADLPAQVLDGQYRYLLVVLDPPAIVKESAKSNNVAVLDLLSLLQGQ